LVSILHASTKEHLRDRTMDDQSEAPIGRETVDQYARFDLPVAGFREYWYPVAKARSIGRQPRAFKLLSDDVVLFRDGGRVHALSDRCPHRGAKLSVGKCQFPGTGTISCPYHGWTFKGDTGECVAAIMEGPDSRVPGAVKVRAYPVEERRGLVWLFMGDGEMVPFADDVPDLIADETNFFTISAIEDYDCNWRLLTDNWTNEHHGPYVHGNSPELVFQPLPPFALSLSVMDHKNGYSIGVRGEGGITSACFRGLGSFPRSTWHRFMKPTGRGARANWEQTPAAREFGVLTPSTTRLPGMVIVARPQAQYFLIQWAVPMDAGRTRLFNINCFRRRGVWRELYDRLHYAVWRGWAHDWIFSDQDKVVVESVVAGRERLSSTDVGVIGWRKFASAHARRAKPNVRAGSADADPL
jgi:phenylpropionate dioxygenase-like ring-hydroxylating dioxygenase large terminal subunit